MEEAVAGHRQFYARFGTDSVFAKTHLMLPFKEYALAYFIALDPLIKPYNLRVSDLLDQREKGKNYEEILGTKLKTAEAREVVARSKEILASYLKS